jgi:signal peptidase I
MNPENEPNLSQIPQKSKWKEIVREIVLFLIIAFGIVLPFRIYIAEPYLVDGRSMDPTFATGQYLIVNKLSYELTGKVQRNSVLVFRYPGDTSKNFIKRVIGLPGETVKIVNGEVTIINSENPNGITLDQSYIKFPSPSDNMTVNLASDEYFVMGDNRLESFDSRMWGPLNKKYILGEPFVRLFPLNKIGLIPGKE